MVGEHNKFSTLEEVSEVSNPEVECQQLSVKGAVFSLRRAQLFAEECQGLPNTVHQLLENGPYRQIRSIHGAVYRGCVGIVALASADLTS